MAKACRVNMDSKLLFLKWNRSVQILIIRLFNKVTIYQPYIFLHPIKDALFVSLLSARFYLPPKHTVKCSN